jgi:hypothetical protein
MKHYDTAQWLQFLRGELDSKFQTAMQQHLDLPCRKCGATLALLRQVDATAKRDSALELPKAAVQQARSIFALEKPARIELNARTVARLVFDSFREPAMAGVRTTGHIARQMMYSAGDYTIDVRLEPDADPAQVVMVGQILHQSQTATGSVPVVLQGARRELSRAVTTEFGEFQFVYRPVTSLRLLIPVNAGADSIEIAVPRVKPKQKEKTTRRPKHK